MNMQSNNLGTIARTENDNDSHFTRTGASNCAVCAKLVTFFATPLQEEAELSMGKVASLLEGNCPHVNFIKNASFSHGHVFDYPMQEISFNTPENSSFVFLRLRYREGDEERSTETDGQDLIARPDVTDHPGRAIAVDSQWINDEEVRGWISTCEETHGNRCKSLPLFRHADRIRPFYLIDTEHSCLVQSNEYIKEYIALSYTWGQTETLRNHSDICCELLKPGALAKGEIARRIPQTVRDAIALVRHLGKRYLWVDALCIVQDDVQLLKNELSQMHRIYACASFTIIAAVGKDANYGLRGFKNLTAPRHLVQHRIKLAPPEQLTLGSVIHNSVQTLTAEEVSTYHDRGWTFQEFLFSSRRLIFEKQSVRWHCQCSEWYEHLKPDPDHLWNQRTIKRTETWMHNYLPTLEHLTTLVLEFNQKKLSFPQDAFSAFLGIQTLLHRIYPSGLINGIPEMYFDIALSWRPAKFVERRIAKQVSPSTTPVKCLPSWSWIGWGGKVLFPDDSEFSVGLVSVSDIEGYTAPIAVWYTADTPNSIHKRRINSTWYKYREEARAENFKPSSEWEQEECDSRTRSRMQYRSKHPDGIPKYYYRHIQSSKNTRLCWYPIPLLDQHAEYPLVEQTTFIFTRTTRAFLTAHTTFDKDSDGYNPQFRLLNHQKDKTIGYLRVDEEDDLVKLRPRLNSEQGARFELVATSKGYTGRIFDYKLAEKIAEEQGEWTWRPQIKDCYFVLWIEWVGGTAYRKGMGAVAVQGWEEEKEREMVDLVLG